MSGNSPRVHSIFWGGIFLLKMNRENLRRNIGSKEQTWNRRLHKRKKSRQARLRQQHGTFYFGIFSLNMKPENSRRNIGSNADKKTSQI